MAIGAIETVALRDVWPMEDRDFTPWLCANVGALDSVLGLGLANPRREVGAGDFSIDVVAETDFGDIVIENQYGRSDHRHLGQLVTYLSHRQVHRAIWILEEARPEHVKAVETLNQRGVGQMLDGHGARRQDRRLPRRAPVHRRRPAVRGGVPRSAESGEPPA